MRTLLLIDIQNDFLPTGALAVPAGDQIIPLINTLQQHFDLVVATQDWHPAGHKSFACSHKDKRPFDIITWKNHEQVLWPDHCVQDTSGADLSPALETKKVAAVFRKGMDINIDSYNGFYDNGHLKSTGLSHYLKGMQATELFLAGLAGDFCVYFTAKDALAEGFVTYVIEDATRSISEQGFSNARRDVLQQGGKLISSYEV